MISEVRAEGPDSEGPDSEGPDSEGPDLEGPDSEGPDSEGPHSEGLKPIQDERMPKVCFCMKMSRSHVSHNL